MKRPPPSMKGIKDEQRAIFILTLRVYSKSSPGPYRFVPRPVQSGHRESASSFPAKHNVWRSDRAWPPLDMEGVDASDRKPAESRSPLHRVPASRHRAPPRHHFAVLRSASIGRDVSRARPPAVPIYWRAAPVLSGTSQLVVFWQL